MKYELNKSEAALMNLNDWASLCHQHSLDSGWWKPPSILSRSTFRAWREIATPVKIALIHSEVSEALEGFRKGGWDDHLPHRLQSEVELADALIRIFDLAGAHNFDLMGAVREKFLYNLERPDHKQEARDAPGGKRF